MANPKFKDFLVSENQRNHDGHKTFERFIRKALKRDDVEVLVAHHIVYLVPDEEPNEIPSADTLCFSPELMGAVFGEKRAGQIMLTLSHRTPELRDKVLADFLDALDLEEADARRAVAAAV
jgi:hypothetical protein